MSTTPAPESTGVLTEQWNVTYTHATGPIVGEFLRRLKEDATLVGRHCPQCDRVLMPPRAFCDRDYADTDRWVEVGNTGIVETFTVVFQKFQGLPDPPYCIAYVRLDGADTSILNYVRGVEMSDAEAVRANLKVGTPVRVVVAPPDQRQGRVTDFWFEVQS
jgi:uncharacterized OB-fold protein